MKTNKEKAWELYNDNTYLGLGRWNRLCQNAGFYKTNFIKLELLTLKEYMVFRKYGIKKPYLAVRLAIRSIFLAEKKAHKL